MSGERDERAVADGLRGLNELRSEIEAVERQLRALRSRRDKRIRSTVGHGASEREAARSAGVSASYAHTAAKNGALTATVLSERRRLTRR